MDGAALDAPTWQRGVGLVFQDARLFPHLSVAGNLAFAAKRAPDSGMSVDEAARQTGCQHLLARAVTHLSGGERNRVALARALLATPKLLLLDEPFAALDGVARAEFLELLARIHEQTGLAMLIVSHRIDDAASLAEHLVALDGGQVIAHGPLGSNEARIALQRMLSVHDIGVALPASAMTLQSSRGDRHVWVRADHVLLASAQPTGLSARNIWRGVVASMTDEESGSVLVGVKTAHGLVLSRITSSAARDLQLTTGAEVWVVVKAHAI